MSPPNHFHTLLPKVGRQLMIIIRFWPLISQRPLQFMHLPKSVLRFFFFFLDLSTIATSYSQQCYFKEWHSLFFTLIQFVLPNEWHSTIWTQFSRDPPYKMWCYEGGSHWQANTVLFDVLIISVYHSIYSACQTCMNKPLRIWASWYLTMGPLLQRKIQESWTVVTNSVVVNLFSKTRRFHNPQSRILWFQYSTKIEFIHSCLTQTYFFMWLTLSSVPLCRILRGLIFTAHFRFML